MRIASSDRNEKLLYLAVVLFLIADLRELVVVDAFASNRGRWAVLLLIAFLIPVHRWLRKRTPPARWVWAGLAVGAVVAGMVSFTDLGATLRSSPGIPHVGGGGLPLRETLTRGLTGTGWLLTLALALLFVVPGRHFLWASRHEHGPMRLAGRTGLILVVGVVGWAVASSPPLVEQVGAMGFYVLATFVLYALLRSSERKHYLAPVERKKRVSVTIIAKNEADRIGKCLDSVHGWAEEIVVLDSGSTDGTVAIAREYTDRVYETDWPGYGPQKQRALEKATCEWVLSIDADEEVTPELRHDIDAALGADPACVAYKLPWGVIVYGKLLDFGQSARAPLRLFRREGSRFTDVQVHETIIPPPGPVGRLHGRLLHYTQRDFGHALQKVAHYGWLGAKKRFEAGKRGPGGTFGAVLRALWVFFQIYFVRLGLLDGQAGLVTAVLYAQVNFDKYAGLWALRTERRQSVGLKD